MNCVTCTSCGSTKPAKSSLAVPVCSECGAEATGFPLHPIPHLEILRFLCKPFPPGRPKRRAVGVPREDGKTTLFRGHCLWEIQHDPDTTVLFDGETNSLSAQSLKVLKAIAETDRFREVFGDWSGKDTDPRRTGWRENEITVAMRTRVGDQPTISTGGVDTALTGKHPKRAYGDDWQGNSNFETELKRESVWEHLRQLVSLAGRHGEVRAAFTVWHTDGWVGRVQRNPRVARGWEFMIRSAADRVGPLRGVSAIPNAARYREARKLLGWTEEQLDADAKAGGCYFPEHQPMEWLLAALDEIGEEKFSRQYMNNAIVLSRSIGMPAAYFCGGCKGKDPNCAADIHEIPPLLKVMACDPATGREFARSESGFAVGGMDRPAPGARRGNFWVFDGYGLDSLPDETQANFFALCARHEPYTAILEEASNSSVGFHLREMMERTGIFLPLQVIPAPPSAEKDSRIFYHLQPHYRAGRVYHHIRLKGGPMEAQLLEFGASGKKDILDALARVFHELFSPSVAVAATPGRFFPWDKTADDGSDTLRVMMDRLTSPADGYTGWGLPQ